MAAIYLPLLPAAGELVGAARSPANWRALFADPQLSQALAATLVSTLLSVGGALLIALTIVAALWPSARWRRLASRLPLLLAVPHLAGDGGAAAVRRRGWLWQRLPFLTPPVDRYGIGLGLTMALKESAFVLWVIYGLLGEKRLADQATALKSLGYGRWQCLRWLVLPALLPALGMVLLATTAWSLSAVDVALVLGPGNPPTLAVLAWQWLSQGDELQQAKGALASLLLMAILGGLALVAGRMAATAPVPARSARCSSPASSCPARPPAGGAAAAERSAGRAIAGGAGALGAAADGCSGQQPWAGAGGLRPRRGCLPAVAGLRPGARRWLGLATAGPAGPAAGRRPVPVGAVCLA